ncbi:MAG TPA: hypothetical protein DDW73_09120 [Rhizobium sp.]|jgi:hypothetical protein|nr:hypothetical protein [Rhizobium sp.]
MNAIFNRSYNHLIDLIRDDGSYIYKYKLGDPTHSDKYNILRHAGCVWALNTFSINESKNPRIDLALRYLLSKMETGPNGIGTCIPEDDSIKIGANALALLALLSTDRPEQYKSTIDGLISYMFSQQKRDLDFVHKVDRHSGQATDFYSDYYTGEVLFSLVKYAIVFSDADVLEKAERALIARLKQRYGIKQHSHWMMYAASTMFQIRPSYGLIWYTKNFIDEVVNNNGYRTWGRGTPIACRTEALLSALDVAQRASFPEYYIANVIGEISKNIATQAEYHLPNGGFSGRKNNNIVRIDFIQHHLPGFYPGNFSKLGFGSEYVKGEFPARKDAKSW